jgi:hypothetical protein
LAQTWSLEQLANRDPSALSATLRTQSLCPESVLMQYLPPRTSSSQIKNGCIVIDTPAGDLHPPPHTQDLPQNKTNKKTNQIKHIK